ncbi:hypothetical protein INT45_011170 [Circinella minor]|uniref:Reverse transcriptase n=1 Tax=Circinella minor TaxID=1195481 RepID=A0A8H7V6X9_9FUNG|nr:hypothetical protein INT45_011170 [Circinella minor]
MRIVERQNPDLILGMDWVDQYDILLDPALRQVFPRQQTTTITTQSKEETKLPAEITKNLGKYPAVYDDSATQTFTNAPVKHSIDTGDAKPVSSPDYRRSPKERAVIKEQVTEMLQRGVIEPSNSPWASQLVVVEKGENKYRCCIQRTMAS